MGDTPKESSVPADIETCDKKCGGDQTQNCGGGMRLNLFEYSPLPPDETTLDLSEARLENARIVQRGTETVV
jgi:hypothetical protein